MSPKVKICGLTTFEAVEAANNADYLGFIFFAQSPRHVTAKQAARLAGSAHKPVVAVTVNPDDILLDDIFAHFPPDYIQLHGQENPDRVAAIKEKYKTPVIKAISVRSGSDIAIAQDYNTIADILMFDAKAPEGGLPGGNGLSFDWALLAGHRLKKTWFLSGGINIDNVEEALRTSGASMVDVSSSVESSPGVKEPALVQAFIEKVKSITL